MLPPKVNGLLFAEHVSRALLGHRNSALETCSENKVTLSPCLLQFEDWMRSRSLYCWLA